MSEPTGDGKQQPDPEQQPEAAPGDPHDETSGSVFNDPTAPVWADPTAPIPATPAAEVPSAWVQDTPEPPLVPPAPPTPPGVSSPYGQQPPAPQAIPPVSNPYAQTPPAPPYAPPCSDPYGQQYPAPPEGQQYPAYGQQYYAPGAPAVPSNTSAVVLTIVSGVSMLGTAFLVGIPSLIFGIMALTSNTIDPVGSRKKSRIGWIIYAVNVGILVLLIVGVIALFVVSGTSSTGSDAGY